MRSHAPLLALLVANAVSVTGNALTLEALQALFANGLAADPEWFYRAAVIDYVVEDARLFA